MYCLYCGDCCKTMSPFMEEDEHRNKPSCKYLKKADSFFYCEIYEQRPFQCSNHGFKDSHFCPIGLDVLELSNHDKIINRIQFGEFIIDSKKG